MSDDPKTPDVVLEPARTDVRRQHGVLLVLRDSEVPKWRQAAKAAMQMLDVQLRDKAMTPSHAPEMPGGVEGFVAQPYRLLMTWIPDWSPHPHAGRHVVRIDTILT